MTTTNGSGSGGTLLPANGREHDLDDKQNTSRHHSGAQNKKRPFDCVERRQPAHLHHPQTDTRRQSTGAATRAPAVVSVASSALAPSQARVRSANSIVLSHRSPCAADCLMVGTGGWQRARSVCSAERGGARFFRKGGGRGTQDYLHSSSIFNRRVLSARSRPHRRELSGQ